MDFLKAILSIFAVIMFVGICVEGIEKGNDNLRKWEELLFLLAIAGIVIILFVI
jgi:hypothetical protein